MYFLLFIEKVKSKESSYRISTKSYSNRNVIWDVGYQSQLYEFQKVKKSLRWIDIILSVKVHYSLPNVQEVRD